METEKIKSICLQCNGPIELLYDNVWRHVGKSPRHRVKPKPVAEVRPVDEVKDVIQSDQEISR